MNKLLKPGELDQDLERDLEIAMQEEKRDTPDLMVTNRDLVPRSKETFAKQLELLQARIDSVNKTIAEAGRARDEAIARAEGHYKEFAHQAERDLYQIKTLKAAIELAMAVLTHE